MQTSISDLEVRFRSESRMEVRSSLRTVLSVACGHPIRTTLRPESVLPTTCLVTARPASALDTVWLTREILETSPSTLSRTHLLIWYCRYLIMSTYQICR